MGKKAQLKIIGRMASILWTDHANVTRQQTIAPQDIDVKLLRWMAEIMQEIDKNGDGEIDFQEFMQMMRGP